jgi:hypothetical protein
VPIIIRKVINRVLKGNECPMGGNHSYVNSRSSTLVVLVCIKCGNTKDVGLGSLKGGTKIIHRSC